MHTALLLAGVWIVNLLGAMSPGPAFVMITRISAAHSRPAALAAAGGAALGVLVWATAATLGIQVILARAMWLYELMQIAGGLYLLWLGVAAWRHGSHATTTSNAATSLSAPRAFRIGLLTNLSNPKVIVFFGSIFVALFAPGTPLWVRLAALAIVAFNEIAWYSSVALVFSSSPVQNAYRRARKWVERVAGTAMCGFGVHLLAAIRR
jgi:threonine efflux protein